MNRLASTAQAWIAHAFGSRRRAHEYRRWALEYPVASDAYERWKKQSDRQWQNAKGALDKARQLREHHHVA